MTKIKWVNPHSWLYFDVKDAQGKVTNWGVEFGAPNQLAKIGLKKTDVAPGTAIHIRGYLAKNGGPYGYSVIVTLPDGRNFQTGGAQDAPSASHRQCDSVRATMPVALKARFAAALIVLC